MKSTPLISIITVSYNAVKTIEQTILSVINQAESRLEYIIIDGGSSDGTIDIIKKYSSQIDYWISESDNGIYDAMNKGASKAKGKYLAFLNADDWYEPNVIKDIINHTDGINDLVYGIIKIHNKTGFLYAHGASMNNIHNEMIAHPATLIKKDIFYQLGGYDLSYKYVADYDLMLRLYNRGGKFYFTDKIIANFRLDGASSSYKSLLEKNELKRKYCNRSFFKYILCKLFIRIYASTL